MKRVALLLLCLGFICSCGEKEDIPGEASNPLLGCWAFNSTSVIEYYEFLSDGTMNMYQEESRTFLRFENGILYVPKNVSWRLLKDYTYRLDGNTLYLGDYPNRNVVVTSDTFIQNGDVLWRRINSFRYAD